MLKFRVVTPEFSFFGFALKLVCGGGLQVTVCGYFSYYQVRPSFISFSQDLRGSFATLPKSSRLPTFVKLRPRDCCAASSTACCSNKLIINCPSRWPWPSSIQTVSLSCSSPVFLCRLPNMFNVVHILIGK